MQNKITNSFGLLAIAFVFLCAALLNNVLFDKVRVDLTENQIYTVSNATKKLLQDIDEPINLYFFFSDKTSEGYTGIRNYASRVKSLLEEFEVASNGHINLQIIDPEPFSESEDKADEFGLNGVKLSAAGDSLYFGLGGTNSLDDRETIAFFDPQQESFLEYEIAKLIYKLSNPKPVQISFISDLPLEGGPNRMTGRMDPAWAIYEQLQQLYQVELLEKENAAIPEKTDVLVLVHPKNYDEALQYAIDQYVLKGGKVIAFVDPNAESSPSAMGISSRSNLAQLFKVWGVAYDPEKIVVDAESGLEIHLPNGGSGRHIGYLGLSDNNIDREDVTTASLELINGASFGSLSKLEGSKTNFEPLVMSSVHSSLMDSSKYTSSAKDPQALLTEFQDANTQYTLAARVSGPIKSAFENPPEGIDPASHQSEADNFQAIIVADTDILSDRFWVNRNNFFGSPILVPFANNSDLVTNIVENLSGSVALINIRARGRYARPFEVVDQLTLDAEAKFRQKEQELQARLKETESKLSDLQTQQGEGAALVLTPEQESTIETFLKEKIEIRKELREVRHQLDKDIDALGTVLKFINIAFMPCLLTLLLIFVARQIRHRQVI